MVLKEFEQITLALLKNGNVNSYCLCYDLYFGALCSYANNIIKEPAVAEELVQELFLGIWQNREKLPENSSLKGYLLTAVRNDCLDFLKHKKIEKQYAEEYIRNNPVSYENIFNDLVDSEIQLSLQAALEKLPDRCREVFLMSRHNYMSYKEIASKLGISVKTVENQISAALRILRKELEHLL